MKFGEWFLKQNIRCCKENLGTLFIKKKGKYVISGKVAFHFYDTHGLPVEVTEWAISQKMKAICLGLLENENG